jgi:hypothetical protein
MAIDHPRHNKLASRIDYVDVASPCGYGRGSADRRNPLFVDADDAVGYDLTLDRIEDGTTNDVHARHCHLLACVLSLSVRKKACAYVRTTLVLDNTVDLHHTWLLR